MKSAQAIPHDLKKTERPERPLCCTTKILPKSHFPQSQGVKYGPIVADIERSKGVYSWATVSLKEGKNREIKRVMESLGLKVARLIRVGYGPFQLGHLAEGAVEEIPARLWRERLGIGRKKRG